MFENLKIQQDFNATYKKIPQINEGKYELFRKAP